ncbi:LIC10906 family membrane protein [Leptospira alexanderi]|uniref:Membrane protein n=1 Tax=Leptospira alexanderi serovar Manhao 3 str. L 60 TaxID=1049759 RepID=V6HSW2_9LEPT|nr:membrane protein [Leptospira alexanderi]EQA60680.1 putative membrane protein [Leptospira alexanderi serovar Manhao 3 str. L 60]
MSIFFTLLTSSLIFGFGYYIKKLSNPLIEVRRNFFYLTVSVGLWTLFSGCRQFIPYSIRLYAPNWILISVIFAPYFLSKIVNKLINENYNTSYFRKAIEICLISYLVFSALCFNLIKIIDINTLAYEPKLAYHILILYSILWISESIFKLAKRLIDSDGMIRVRLSLMSFGITSAFLIIIPLVWILPFFEIYLGSYAFIGTMICIGFWGVAILHYDAFQTRLEIFSGKQVPILNRITLNPILKLYSILDPEEFEMKRLNANSVLAKEVLDTAFDWFFKANIPFQATARKIAIKYDKYLK